MSERLARGFGILKAILPLVGIVMEFCWLYPWILLLTGMFYGRTPTPLLDAWTVFALLLLGSVTLKAVIGRPWPLLWARVTVVGVGLLAGLAAIKINYYPGYALFDLRWIPVLFRAAHDALPVVVPAVMGALAATLLWWRGVVLAEREFSHFEIDRGFRRGVGWSVLFVLFSAVYGDTRGFALTQPAPAYLLAFFSLSLLALAVARLVGIWQESQADEGQALAMNRHWLLLLLGVVGLIFSGAVVLSGLLNVDFRPALGALFRPLVPVIEFVFLVIFSVALVIARVIVFIFSRLPFRRGAERAVPTNPPSLADIFKDLPPHVVSGARWGMVLLVVVLLIVLVAISVVRARRRQRARDEDERASVWSTESLVAGLGAAWRSLWSRLRPPQSSREIPAVSEIRVVYRELLRLGAALGVPRQPYQTPYEYRPRLAQRLPESDADLFALTEAYIRVRYTPHIPAEGEITAARVALERVTAAGRGTPPD